MQCIALNLKHQPVAVKDSLCNHLPGRVLLALQLVLKKQVPIADLSHGDLPVFRLSQACHPLHLAARI